MTRLREWAVRLWATLVRRDSASDIEDELRFHLEMAEQDAHRRGLSPRDARMQAGALAQAADAVHDQRALGWLRDFLRDTRHGIRLLAASPLFTAAAIGSLALGIGANTAIFSLIDAVMLRSLPVRDPGRLVQLTRVRGNFSYPLFHQFESETHSFEGLLAHASMGKREITLAADPETVTTEAVTANYYSVLGLTAAAGRVFDAQTAAPVAVLSHAFWKRRFGLDAAAIGRTFRLNRTIFTIVGVTPPAFHGITAGEDPDVTFPLTLDSEVRGGESWLRYDSRGWLSVMGRLRRDRSLATAQTEVSGIFARFAEAQAEHATNEVFRRQILAQRMIVESAPNGLDYLRRRFSEPLLVLMGIVALVLLIACANLANLLLGRSAARRREIAVRLAIGAGRGRILRQLLAEGVLLAVAAGAFGVLLAWWSADALVKLMANGGDPILLHISPDLRVLSFTAAVSVAACLLFSVAPALQAIRVGIQPGLAEARATRWILGRALIVAQVAISVVLLIGAGLFTRTLIRLYSLETGFDRTGVLLFDLNSAHAALRGAPLRTRVLDDLRGVPGVTSVSYAMSAIGRTGWDGSIRVEGYNFTTNEDDRVDLAAIVPAYFQTLRTPLLAGREFDARDVATSPRVAVVNEALARRFFRGRSPIGKWIALAGSEAHLEIVGVVKDAQPRSLRDGVPPFLYMSLAQRGDPGWGSYLVRGTVTPGVVAAAVERIDPKLRTTNVRTLEEDLSRTILQERIMGTLSGFFGALSLVLVLLGIYGVMASQVARRRKEIGIRIALGARPVQVTRMVLGESARPVALGVAVGVAGALALTRFAEKMLFGVKSTDLLTFSTACVLLVALSLAAAWVPGRTAARLNPVETLKVG